MENKRNLNLRNTLISACNNVPFYQDIINVDKLNDCSDVELYNIFLNIPIVDKRIIRKDYLQFINCNLKNIDIDNSFESTDYNGKENIIKLEDKTLIAEYTSGSNGIPFMVIKSIEERIRLGKNLWKLRNAFYPASPDKMLYFIHKPQEVVYPVTFYRDENEPQNLINEIEFIKRGWQRRSRRRGFVFSTQRQIDKFPLVVFTLNAA